MEGNFADFTYRLQSSEGSSNVSGGSWRCQPHFATDRHPRSRHNGCAKSCTTCKHLIGLSLRQQAKSDCFWFDLELKTLSGCMISGNVSPSTW